MEIYIVYIFVDTHRVHIVCHVLCWMSLNLHFLMTQIDEKRKLLFHVRNFLHYIKQSKWILLEIAIHTRYYNHVKVMLVFVHHEFLADILDNRIAYIHSYCRRARKALQYIAGSTVAANT